ncbi:testis-expressed protein 10 homolog [Gigantopelta aegis]|uniref:testis-expressed protein 10 homolog n=1 Tax=Gigantopelta aegis TaxID=1735272 RepID=UPI001B887B88|nr:testis-expressed protein 10 homolog [Gigantopelta aegis]
MSKTKKRKKDFQKVKLKVGKTLPRGQNVTNTSFKTRSIQVVQKIKGVNSEPSTHRKLNLKDLLSQCQHYNSSVRHEAVSGLKELVTLHPHLIPLHLSAILEKTSQLFTDKDLVVRQAVIRVLKVIFSSVSSNQIAPFFPLLSAHLCCAMTHIYEDIQRDSLNVFDLLLETYPDLVTNNSTQILPNFIAQISRDHGTGQSKSPGNRKDFGRSLAITPNSRMSVHRWRSGVLGRLHKLLTAILTSKVQDTEEDEKKNSVVKWQPSVETVQTFPSYITSSWLTPGFMLSSDRNLVTVSSSSSVSSADGEYDVKKFAHTLLPLLIECWIESRPVDDNSNVTGSLVPLNVLSMMSTITSVIQLLWESLVAQQHVSQDDSITDFLASYLKDFEKHFMTSFPYAAHESLHPPKKAKKDKNIPPVSVESLNLAVCDIMTYFIDTPAVSMEMPWIVQVYGYVISCLKGRQLDASQIKVIIRVIKKLIVLSRPEGDDAELLEAALQYYLSSHPLSAERKLFLHLFADQILERSNCQVRCRQNITDRFLQSLPELLLLVLADNVEMSVVITSVMKRAACQKCSPLFVSLEEVLVTLLDPDSGVLVKCKSEVQTRLLEILYWFPLLTADLLKPLCRLLMDENVEAGVSLSVVDIIHHRYLKFADQTDTVETSGYLSFIMTMLTGLDSEKLAAMCDEGEGEGDSESLSLYRICWSVSRQRWTKHLSLVEHITSLLNQFSHQREMAAVVSYFWTSLMKQHKIVSILTVYGILITGRHLLSHDQPNEWENTITNLCLSLVNELTRKEGQNDAVHAEDAVTLWSSCCGFLVAGPGIFDIFLQKAVSFLLTLSSEDAVCVLTTAMTNVLQQEFIQTYEKTRVATQSLEQFKETVELKVPNLLQKQWWSDFVYQISLT